MRRLLQLLTFAAALAALLVASAGGGVSRSQPYAGKYLMPREYAAAAAKYHSGIGLVKDTAKAGGESRWNLGAWHDNYDLAGVLKSRDCGVDEINVPASAVGTAAELDLRTDSFDPPVVALVLSNSVEAAHRLFAQPWVRKGVRTIRMWQPWVAVTSGWAWFPRWWVYSQLQHRWVATGRYVQQAIAGVANYLLLTKRTVSRGTALELARKWARSLGVAEGQLGVRDGIVAWVAVPAMPSSPPADGIGPRPVPNTGT